MPLKSDAANLPPLRATLKVIVFGSSLLFAASKPALERESSEHMTAVERHMHSCVVRVQARLPDGSTDFGSGISIALDTAAANCNVTRNWRAVAIAAKTMDGLGMFPFWAHASVIGGNVSLLRMVRPLSLPLASMAQIPKIGEPMAALDFTGGLTPRIHTSELVRPHPHVGALVLEASSAFEQGASGGGVFNVAGTPVGLVTFRSRETAPPQTTTQSPTSTSTKMTLCHHCIAHRAVWNLPS